MGDLSLFRGAAKSVCSKACAAEMRSAKRYGRLWDPTASFGSVDPLNDTPPGSRFAGKSETRVFLFRAHLGSDRRVSWRRYEGLLALLGYEFSSHPFHHFLEAAGLSIADGGTLIDVHVYAAAHFKSHGPAKSLQSAGANDRIRIRH